MRKLDVKHTKRHAAIMQIVGEEGTCSIAGLAERLGVSQESIRRDVRPLTKAEKLVRVHGAVTLPFHFAEAPFEKRMRENARAKRAIARHAANKVADGDSVMFDTGTTTSLVARELLSRKNLTVVTNSSDIARTLATVNGNTVYMAGGKLHGDNGAAFGALAVDFLKSFSVRLSFISIGALDAGMGAMDYLLDEAQIARTVLEQGETSYILTDASKFERRGLVQVCDFIGFDGLVTNIRPPKALTDRLTEADVMLEVV
ncbi:MAG TPA: DeoR/GlpR transcriptional regulator [Rhizobiales bacterium]|nr:DeoR/GlpR transcriptional regulator [Hyphomicrobiales bacterium]